MRKVDPEKVEAKRRQILDAAIDCFARQGFHGTSTASICAAAGMSPGNLFHYFPTKASIIEAIAQDEQLATAEIFEKWSGAEDALTAIEEIVVEWMRLASEPTYARISIEVGAEASRNPDIKALFLVNDQRVKGRMITLIERGIRQGAIDAALAPDLLASWLIALAEGAVGRVVFESKFDLSAHEPVFRRIVRRTLQK